MKRVVHVMASGARGGGAEHLKGLVREQRALGLVPCAVVGDDGPLAQQLGSDVERVSTIDLMRSRWDVSAPRRLRRAISEMEPDLVHLHGTRAAFFAGLTSSGTPSVYTVHGLSYRKQGPLAAWAAGTAAEGLACARASRVITVARADLDDLVARRFVSRDKITHVPNAMDLERFVPHDRDEARRRMGVSPDGFVVLTVSRLVPQKAVADAIDALARVRDVTFVVVGDGPERAELRTRAAGRGLHAVFLGARDDVPALLAGADVFLLASRWEGEPIALLEALAMRLPCVATATDGSREILEGSGAGLLAPIGDVNAIAEAVTRLRREPELRQTMAGQARDVVRHRSFRENARSVLDVYGSVA
jgi:glycosyltransferase involved in cell wall biosynthesis